MASLRLNGHYVEPKDLMLMLGDSLDRASDHDMERALDIHRMLQALGRRDPHVKALRIYVVRAGRRGGAPSEGGADKRRWP